MAGPVAYALYGALRLARLDRSGIAYFDRTLEGFWASYQAAALAFIPYLLTLQLEITDLQWKKAGAPRIYAVMVIGYVIFWAGYPLVVMPLLQWLGRERRAFDFLVPYNWAQFLETAALLFVQALAAGAVLPKSAAIAALSALQAATLVYEWFIARVALEVTGGQATLIVAVNFAFAMVVSGIRDALIGG
jgi:hypothetical protein